MPRKQLSIFQKWQRLNLKLIATEMTYTKFLTNGMKNEIFIVVPLVVTLSTFYMLLMSLGLGWMHHLLIYLNAGAVEWQV